MDRGLWAWRITVSFMVLLIVAGATTVLHGRMNGDYDCPVFYDDETDWVTCYLIETEYCEDMGCQRISYSLERLACDCRSNPNE